MLHLTNGDSAASSMRQAGLPGEVIAWSDVLYEGPTPAEHGSVWRETRAAYLSACGYGTYEHIVRDYARDDEAISRYSQHDELVLWFEHDLFDQLLLARHLHWLGTRGPAETRLSLICIDAYPGVEPFHGLGQLTPAQLATLFPARQPIVRRQLNAGADVWRAFTSDDPRGLNLIVQDGLEELPFMAGALKRYLEEFPGAADGLSRTERAVLLELRDAPRRARELFLAIQQREERVFMGDATFWRILRDLAAPPRPLVEIASGTAREGGIPDTEVLITEAGMRVLNGEDAIRLRGLDRWMGGVHLTPDRAWRWDGAQVGPPGL
jgi:uncharacterized protein DUF1835